MFEKIIAWVIVISFLLVLMFGGVVSKLNEEAIFYKMPIAYYCLTEESKQVRDLGWLDNAYEFITAGKRASQWVIDAISSTKFLITAEPDQMVMQKFGDRFYIYSNSRAGIDKVRPEKVNSIEECTDWRKQYVLPDGYIYAARQVEGTVKRYTNVLDGTTVRINERFSISSNGYRTASGCVSTAWLPVRTGDVVRVNVPRSAHSTTNCIIVYKDSAGEYLLSGYRTELSVPIAEECDGSVTSFTVGTVYKTLGDPSSGNRVIDGVSYMLINLQLSNYDVAENDASNLVITVNEEIKEEIVASYKWYNTNRIYDDTEYADSNGGYYDGWLVGWKRGMVHMVFVTPHKPGYEFYYDSNTRQFTGYKYVGEES